MAGARCKQSKLTELEEKWASTETVTPEITAKAIDTFKAIKFTKYKPDEIPRDLKLLFVAPFLTKNPRRLPVPDFLKKETNPFPIYPCELDENSCLIGSLNGCLRSGCIPNGYQLLSLTKGGVASEIRSALEKYVDNPGIVIPKCTPLTAY